MKVINFIVMLLIVIGALNWGLVGFFEYNFIESIFGYGFGRFIFAVVGLAGIWGISFLVKCCGGCKCGPNCSCCSKKKDQ